MQHVPPYTRPNRNDDLALVAKYLCATSENGAYLVDGIDIAADDMRSRGFLVEALTAACRTLAQRGRAGHWTYALPIHDSLVRILRAELAELYVRLDRSTEVLVQADQRRAAA